MDDELALAFSWVGIYHPSLFDGMPDIYFQLDPLLKKMTSKLVSGEHFIDLWFDVGTIISD